MLDTDVAMLRKQAEFMQRLSPDQRLLWVLTWSNALLRESRMAWSSDSGMASSTGPLDRSSVMSEGMDLEAWLRAQHGDAIPAGFGAAHCAWRRRQGVHAGAGG